MRKKKLYIVFTLLMLGFVAGNSNQSVFADTVIDAKPETTIPSKPDDTIDVKPQTNNTDKNSVENSNQSNQESHIKKDGWDEGKNHYYVNGKKVKGIKKIEGNFYYFQSDGQLYKKIGLQTINEKTYYFTKKHTMKTGVVKVGKYHYFFRKKNGERFEEAGIKKLDGKYYCFNSQYKLLKGWKRDTNNNRLYFSKKKYAAYIGWHYIGKYKFYFKKNGRLQQDVRGKLSAKQKTSYLIKVNRLSSCVTVYVKDGKKGYTIPIVAFICSAGQDTPIGTFHIRDKLRWHELMGPSWGQWCEHLTPDILFHSVYYNERNNNKTLSVSAYNKLGTMASHGCVRLKAGDAKWIYDNCKVGTTVVIYNSKNPSPFDKPILKKLRPNHTWDPTDPAFR